MNTRPIIIRSVLVAVMLLALTPAAMARANPPETTIVSADSTFINDFNCSFPLVEQVSGAYRDTLHFDHNGLLTREFLSPQFQGPLTVTWTNPATETSLTSHEASTIIVYYNPDGSFQELRNQGLTFQVSVPGEGLLLLDVGRIVIERGQGISFEAGPHQELNGDTTAFCSYLEQ